jgi:fimbrial chaperone protein
MKTKRALISQALTGLAFLALATFGMAARASSFTVAPVRVTLSAKQTVAAVTVTNTGTEPTVVQLETMQWAQDQGQEILDLSTSVLATPPIFTVEPGKSQIVRIGLRRQPDPARELTYRLILREVPSQDAPVNSLRVALKISMPVFIAPTGATAAPTLQWHAQRLPDGNIRIVAFNSGTAHIQLGQLQVVQAGNGTTVGTHPTADYVLPNNQRSWILTTKSAPAVGTLLRVSSQTDAGQVQSDVALENDGALAPPTAAR